MNNISINNESLELSIGKTYYIIDALYLDEIKKELLRTHKSLEDIREDVFPYTDTPFAKYVAHREFFSINQIKKVDYEEVITGDMSFFSTDTGLIVIIWEDILIEFIKGYSYENLINSEYELIDKDYWIKLVSKFNLKDIGLVLSNISLENTFDGSGTYKIT